MTITKGRKRGTYLTKKCAHFYIFEEPFIERAINESEHETLSSWIRGCCVGHLRKIPEYRTEEKRFLKERLKLRG